MKISVCMATFNGEKYIENQVKSILNQLSENDEIIISDDNSTDNTVNILKSINSPLIKIIKGPNLGLIKNFENAINQSTGDIIFLSDQDDLWHGEKIKTCSSELFISDAILLVTDCKIIDEHGNVTLESFFKIKGSAPGLIKNMISNSFLGCCMAFKSELKSTILPFPENVAMHDWWIGLIASVYGKVVFINKPLTLYRRHGNNASSTSEKSKTSMKSKIIFRVAMSINIAKNILFKTRE